MTVGRSALRVLVLDDRKEDRLLAIRELRRAYPRVSVREVVDVAQFEAAMAEGGFDVVITDFQLRWSTGLTIVETVKARHPWIPVIMFTATGSQETAVEAMKAGLDDYVVKSPHHIVRLSVAITAALDRTRARQEAEDARRRFLERETELREAAEAANRAKDEFLAVLSHELRTPLTAVLGWARMLRSGRLGATAVDHAVEVIERNALALGKLVEDLLDVSRIIAGRVQLESHVLDLVHVVRAAIEAVAPVALAKEITLQFAPASGVVQVSGDAARLQQVVWNLLTNSIKFTPRDGHVRAAIIVDNGFAVIRVSDSGPGVPREQLSTLFEPFRQGDVSPTRAHGGLGLGLTIVRHLAELHRGTIDVVSPGELGGATFVVRLPRARSRVVVEPPLPDVPRPLAPATATLPSLEGIRVLLVEDDPDTRELLALAFRECRAEVTAVGSAAEALDFMTRDLPDVLVSDIAMADEDGYDLIRKVRALPIERGGATPAVAVTAYARDEDRERSTAAGYNRYVGKPVDPASLCVSVADLLAAVRR